MNVMPYHTQNYNSECMHTLYSIHESFGYRPISGPVIALSLSLYPIEAPGFPFSSHLLIFYILIAHLKCHI